MERFQAIYREDENIVGSLVAPIVALIFAAADNMSRLSSNHGLILKLLQAPLLAVGFGLVNTASSLATGGTVLFAMTGHLSKVATALQKGQVPRTWDDTTRKAIRVLFSFMSGAFLSTLYNQHYQQIEPLVKLPLPPFCTSVGLLYAALFLWYEMPFTNRLRSFLALIPSRSGCTKMPQELIESSIPCLMDVFACGDDDDHSDPIARGIASF